VDEAGLLEARDDLDVDALGPGPVEEHLAVGRLPDGGGGDGPQGGAVDGRHLLEPDEGLDAAVHRRRPEPLHVAGRRAQADHLPLAVEDLDAVLAHARDDEVDRVRADVHGGQGIRHHHYSLALNRAMR
jgi:hypothetical protein